MKKGIVIPLSLSVLVIVLFNNYFSKKEQSLAIGLEKGKILVAKQDIDITTLLTPDLVEEQIIPKKFYQPKSISNI